MRTPLILDASHGEGGGREPSSSTCPALSSHLRTVAWVVQCCRRVRVELAEGAPARVTIDPDV